VLVGEADDDLGLGVAVEVGDHRDRDDLLGGIGPLEGDVERVEVGDDLAGDRIGLEEALREGRLAVLALHAVVGVLAGLPRGDAGVARADVADVAADLEHGPAADLALTGGEALVLDALVAHGAAGRRLTAEGAADAEVIAPGVRVRV